MHLKDYYTILELTPSASPDDVKKAYRRLAHQYHPDKNNNDPYALAQFAEIKEAYETLVNPLRKEHYLQQRWFIKSTGKNTRQQAVTPVTILQQLLELDRYTHTLDEHRMNVTGLHDYLCSLLQNVVIDKLNGFNDPAINSEIVLSALKSARLLPWPLAGSLAERLKKVRPIHEPAASAIQTFIRYKKQLHYWEKRRIWIVLLAVLMLCLVIFMTAVK